MLLSVQKEQQYTSAISDNKMLRSTLLQLLTTLPNNTTQREVPRATGRTAPGGKITLCTQGGVSKLPRLLDLAGRWLGPISCAIYITTEEQLDAWLNFRMAHRGHNKDNNDLIATYVTFHALLEQPQLPLNVNRHPINKLRNLALRYAETDHVFLNDIDFMPPANAHDSLVHRYHASLPPPKTFWVLPAFERFGKLSSSTPSSSSSSSSSRPAVVTTSRHRQQRRNPRQRRRNLEPRDDVTNVTWIPEAKPALLQALSRTMPHEQEHQPEVAPFHAGFPAGHGPCNYSHWYTATTLYNITYDYLFEPYTIVHKQGLPEYYPTFRGFAFNKMSFFMEAHYLGFQFQVLPDAFVVHMNHGGRKGRNDKGGDSKYVKEDFRKYLKDKYHVSQDELDQWK
jgi:Glycosyl-transferase for dystroglycan